MLCNACFYEALDGHPSSEWSHNHPTRDKDTPMSTLVYGHPIECKKEPTGETKYDRDTGEPYKLPERNVYLYGTLMEFDEEELIKLNCEGIGEHKYGFHSWNADGHPTVLGIVLAETDEYKGPLAASIQPTQQWLTDIQRDLDIYLPELSDRPGTLFLPYVSHY